MRRPMPHRGDGFSKDFKPRKRYINLKKLRRFLAKETLQIVAAFAVLTICILGVISSYGNIEGTHIVGLILLWIIILTFVAGMFDLNKFHTGRDVDTSERETNETDKAKKENDA